MKPDKGALARAIVYSIMLAYIFLDLFVFYGPLKTAIKGSNPTSESAIAKEITRGIAARVYFQPILLTQIDRRVQENQWSKGQSHEGLTPERLKELRLAALDSLFNEHLLRIKVRHNPADAKVSEEELADAVADYRKRFTHPAKLQEAIKAQGWKGDQELVARVGAKLEQENYLAKRVRISLSDEELESYYQTHQAAFRQPERIHARQIFFAALEHPNGEARKLAEEAFARLKAGEDFAQVAQTVSEDAGSAGVGGDMGWFSRERLSPDFTDPVFAQAISTINIVETQLGAHLVEVLARSEEKLLTYDEVKTELRVALSNQKREKGLQLYLDTLRRHGRYKVEVFYQVLNRPWSL